VASVLRSTEIHPDEIRFVTFFLQILIASASLRAIAIMRTALALARCPLSRGVRKVTTETLPCQFAGQVSSAARLGVLSVSSYGSSAGFSGSEINNFKPVPINKKDSPPCDFYLCTSCLYATGALTEYSGRKQEIVSGSQWFDVCF